MSVCPGAKEHPPPPHANHLVLQHCWYRHFLHRVFDAQCAVTSGALWPWGVVAVVVSATARCFLRDESEERRRCVRKDVRK